MFCGMCFAFAAGLHCHAARVHGQGVAIAVKPFVAGSSPQQLAVADAADRLSRKECRVAGVSVLASDGLACRPAAAPPAGDC